MRSIASAAAPARASAPSNAIRIRRCLREPDMPKPARHVFVCSQSRPAGHPRGSCGQKGCAEVVNEFMQQWQLRECFAEVMVTPSACIGPCSKGPNVLVYPEGVMYNNV